METEDEVVQALRTAVMERNVSNLEAAMRGAERLGLANYVSTARKKLASFGWTPPSEDPKEAAPIAAAPPKVVPVPPPMVVPVPKDIETKPHVQQPAKHAIDYPSDDSEDEIITLPVEAWPYSIPAYVPGEMPPTPAPMPGPAVEVSQEEPHVSPTAIGPPSPVSPSAAIGATSGSNANNMMSQGGSFQFGGNFALFANNMCSNDQAAQHTAIEAQHASIGPIPTIVSNDPFAPTAPAGASWNRMQDSSWNQMGSPMGSPFEAQVRPPAEAQPPPSATMFMPDADEARNQLRTAIFASDLDGLAAAIQLADQAGLVHDAARGRKKLIALGGSPPPELPAVPLPAPAPVSPAPLAPQNVGAGDFQRLMQMARLGNIASAPPPLSTPPQPPVPPLAQGKTKEEKAAEAKKKKKEDKARKKKEDQKEKKKEAQKEKKKEDQKENKKEDTAETNKEAQREAQKVLTAFKEAAQQKEAAQVLMAFGMEAGDRIARNAIATAVRKLCVDDDASSLHLCEGQKIPEVVFTDRDDVEAFVGQVGEAIAGRAIAVAIQQARVCLNQAGFGYPSPPTPTGAGQRSRKNSAGDRMGIVMAAGPSPEGGFAKVTRQAAWNKKISV